MAKPKRNKGERDRLIMDESDVIKTLEEEVEFLKESINKHREECPDNDIRVIDQTLWSVIDMM